MEFTFTPLRVAALILLLAGFWFVGGYTVPEDLPTRLFRLWAIMILMFAVGAVMATVVDHWIGNLDRSNLRWFYIVLGIAAMLGAAMYLHILRERVKIGAESARVPARVDATHEMVAADPRTGPAVIRRDGSALR